MKNPVMELQEYTQKAKIPMPEYRFEMSGLDHQREFKCFLKVSVLDDEIVTEGTSKKQVKADAAQALLELLPPLPEPEKAQPQKPTVNKNVKPNETVVSKNKKRLIYDWHNAVAVYAAQKGLPYSVETIKTEGSDVEAIGTFGKDIKKVIENNKQSARQEVAKLFFDQLNLAYVDRLDISQMMDRIKKRIKNCKVRIEGDQIEIVTAQDLKEEQISKLENYILDHHPGVRFVYYANEEMLMPPSSKPHALKKTNQFDQNYAATVINSLAPPSFVVRKISWYVESRAVQIHIKPTSKRSITSDVEEFRKAIRDKFKFLVLINQRRKSQLALDALNKVAKDGIVTKEDLAKITIGHYYSKDRKYSEPKIDMRKRVDHRDQHSFTVDSDSSIDLDDAFAVVLNEKGMTVFVHITDLNILLKEGSKEDLAALKQGVTYYGIAKQLPMLPDYMMYQASLLPQKDRMTWTIKMELTEEGKVTKFNIYRSVIRSKFRLDQKQVIKTIDQKANKKSRILKAMVEISEKLKNNRLDNGGLSNFNEENSGYQIVQEFMLLANKCIAEYCVKNKIAIPFRHHKFPGESEELKEAYNSARQQLQDAIAPFIGKAFYSATEKYHEALCFEAYCHFTSPIRRYADLVAQRQIAKHIDKQEVKSLEEIEAVSSKINEAAKDAEQLQAKMIYLEALKKQFDQSGKKMNAVVVKFENGVSYLKPQNDICSFLLVSENRNLKIGGVFQFIQNESYMANIEAFTGNVVFPRGNI